MGRWLIFVLLFICTLTAQTQAADSQALMLLEDQRALAFEQSQALVFKQDELASAKRVYLSLEARIETPGYKSGSTPAMRILLNDAPVTIERLRNKPGKYPFRHDLWVPYYFTDRGLWIAGYYDWQGDKPDDQLLRYVFDVTSLIKPGQNELIIENHFDALPDSTLQLRQIQVLTRDDFPRSKRLAKAQPVEESQGLSRFREKAIALHRGLNRKLDVAEDYKQNLDAVVMPMVDMSVAYEATLADDGVVQVKVADQTVKVHTHVGLPGGEWLPLGEMQVRRDGAMAAEMTSEKLRIGRQLTRHETRLEVRDTVTNLTDGDLPVGLLHEMNVGDVAKVTDFRIAGVKQSQFWANYRPNRLFSTAPIVFVGTDTSSVAMVAEDDALRNQASVLAWDDAVAVGTDMFYLPAGASYTFIWHLYPDERSDYYATINRLRHDWQMYQTIPALFGFVYPGREEYDKPIADSEEKIAHFLDRTGIGIAGVTALERDSQPRRMVYGNESPDRIRHVAADAAAFAQRVKDSGAATQTVIYVDVHLHSDNGDRSKLYELGDSVLLGADGEPRPFRSGWLYHVLPTLGSESARRLFEAQSIYLDEMKFDGLFLDEWAHSNARVSYSHEDGISALTDANLNLVRKVAIVPIAVRDFHQAYAQRALDKGALLIANHFDCTREATDLPILHFAEPVAYNDPKLATAQVGRTPMSLNLKRTRGLWYDTQAFLKQGVLACYYARRLTGNHVLKHVYPITVREVHPGYVIGERKIVANSSGVYSFGRDKPIEVKIFSSPAGLLTRTYRQVPEAGQATQVRVNLDTEAGEVAVLVEQE